jgi:uncharacterized membrane protein YhiD involved in acid resistance
MNFGSDSLLQIVQDSQVGVVDIVIVVILGSILGIIISLVYRKTFRGISYSQSFATSVALLTPITAIVMLTIGSNLARAFGLVGALSIVRFRTVVKDTKDIATIFLSLVVGLAVGTMNYHIAVIGSLLILLFVYILDRVDYGAFSNKSFLVSFIVPQDKLNEKDYKDIIEKHSGSYELINISSADIGKNTIEITYKIGDVDIEDRQDIARDLGKIEGVKNISVISAKNYIEY